MTERILVTGAAGFIGSQVCDRLLDADCTVIGVDNFDPFYDRSIKERWLEPLRERFCFDFVEHDVRDTAWLADIAPEVDAIVHLAARAGVRQSFATPEEYASINAGGTAAVLDAAMRGGTPRVVVISSSSVYGNAGEYPFREDVVGLRPVSPYGASKRAAELFCEAYAASRELTVAVLRLFSVYGPRQRPDQAIMRFSEELRAGGTLRRFGDGATERDFTHVSDVVRGIEAALAWTRQSAAQCEIFNIGSGQSVRLSELICLVAKAWGCEPHVAEDPWQPGDARRTLADLSKARAVLGYEPRITIEEGIPAFVRWYEDTYGR